MMMRRIRGRQVLGLAWRRLMRHRLVSRVAGRSIVLRRLTLALRVLMIRARRIALLGMIWQLTRRGTVVRRARCWRSQGRAMSRVAWSRMRLARLVRTSGRSLGIHRSCGGAGDGRARVRLRSWSIASQGFRSRRSLWWRSSSLVAGEWPIVPCRLRAEGRGGLRIG